jgi:hypothetical protein
MGSVDVKLNQCLSDDDRYRDCFNAAIGCRLITKDAHSQLTGLERMEEGSIQLSGMIRTYSKTRDTIRGYEVMNILSSIVCIENQKDIYYAEAAQIMIYDAFHYNRQLVNIRTANTKKAKEGNQSFDLRGFRQTDRLIPCVTVCIYYGDEPWNAVTSLHELFRFDAFPEDERKQWKELVQDYHITVLDVKRMDDAQIENMESDMKLLFGLVKYSKDKSGIENFMEKHTNDLLEVETNLYQAIAEFVNIRRLDELKKDERTETGGVNMCKAFEDWFQEEREKGEQKGDLLRLIKQICKKMIKGVAPFEIADAVEEDVAYVEQIYNIAERYMPDFDYIEIYKEVESLKNG